MSPPPPPHVDVHLHLPTKTIVKGLVVAILVWAVLKLWPEVVFLSLSLLLAVAMEPVVAWMERRRISRGVAVVLLALGLLVVVAAVIAFVMPPVAEQVSDLVANSAGFRDRVESRLPARSGVLRALVDQMFRLPSSPEVMNEVNQPMFYGQAVLGGLMTTFFVVIATLYLLLDGRRLYAWLLAYVPRAHRGKMAQTVPEVSKVVHAYVQGQLITSLLFAVFAWAVLALLGVPAALPLAILAGVCDVIPVVGIIIATAPAALLALSVSPTASAAVIGLYVVYHLFETYFIVPRVYGNTLRLSTLAVLLALIVGGTLQGLLGTVLALPLVAAYPIIERIWLKNYLGREVIADHKALARAVETGNERAVEMVLQGEQHADEGRRSDVGSPRVSVVSPPPDSSS